jgi:hypothetical protein
MPKKTLIITVIIVAVIALGATAVYIVQRQEAGKVKRPEEVTTIPSAPEKPEAQPSETPPITEVTPQPETPTTTEPIDTSNWKVYRNEKYRFEVRYPINWEFWENKYEQEGRKLAFGLSGTLFDVTFHEKEGYQSSSITVYDNSKNYSLKDWLEKESVIIYPDVPVEPISISGAEGIKAIVIGCCDTQFLSVFLLRGDKIYELRCGYADSPSWRCTDEEFFQQLLSGFKFID